MALAILDLLDYDDANFRFQVDTGTNAYYQLRAGTGVRRDLGIDLVDDVYYTTPLAQNQQGDLFESSREIAVPARHFDRPNTHAQLFSFKTPDRKSPAFSRAIRIPAGYKLPPRGPSDYAASFSRATIMNGSAYRKARRIPCRSAALAHQASFDDVLGAILKLAAPILGDLLKGPAGGATTAAGSTASAGIIAQLLKAVLGAVPGLAGQAVSKEQSRPAPTSNRFARPFIFGIDDALIGAAIGQVIQILPQLVNAANQKRIELHKADNLLTAGILSDINKRLMLDKLAELQKPPQANGSVSSEQLQQLLALLQQAGATAAPAVPQQAAQQSLPPLERRSYAFSNRATLSFEMAAPVAWNGTQKALFARGQNVVLKVRLNVGDPVPKAPLPKAILKIAFQDSAEPRVRFEKTFKRKDVSAGAVMECSFEPGELAHLPAGKPLAVVAEMRWLSAKTGKEVRALGSTDAVLVNKYFLEDQGHETGPEVELRDMKLYRPFWNKVWEAPVLDAASGKSNGRKKYMWELDANVRYSVLLSASHGSNGIMEPKLLQGEVDREGLSQKTEGRMKAGIELSVTELNKLQPLWNAQPLDAERMEAFGATDFLNRNAAELVHRLKLKGKAGQRGMVWIIPVFKMFGFKLASASRIEDSGQVTAVSEEETHFPLPVAARVIGLKAKDY